MRSLTRGLLVPSISGRPFSQFVIAAAVFSLLGCLYYYGAGPSSVDVLPPISTETQKHHPIDILIANAEDGLQQLLAKRTYNVSAAARTYRERRGRHPPPGFDIWFEFAQRHEAVIVEDFFDQIYTDLNPFWAIEAQQIRRQAKNFEHTISVRNGNATWLSDWERPWMLLWHDLVQTIAKHLPDLDMAINVMDESRILVPWETTDNYMEAEQVYREILEPSKVISTYAGLAELDGDPGEPFDLQWHGGRYWELAREGCPPDSPARNVPVVTDFSGSVPMPTSQPKHSYEGFVVNWTMAKDPCMQPHLQGLHGSFVQPISISTSNHLFPLFGGSKLPMNNEILLPPAMYWSKDELYSGGESHGAAWESKENKLLWRGSASGGRNQKDNWTRFQRHRFLSMVNGTSVRLAETTHMDPPNFALPSYDSYTLTAPRNGLLGDWLDLFSDAAFTHLLCFPDEDRAECSYTTPYFAIKPSMPMKEQYKAKYLPDIDGNSFSGRYRGFLGSTSLPIKATIYNEWHDSRLMPWVHFVPMDNSFVDIYGIMDYFLGWSRDGKTRYGAHDEAARRIALGGKEWTEMVLRREDMQVYVFRLLLEYARICDDRRERLGFVADLV